MSCILYNLAIEPLACTLRKSEQLKGYKINGKKEITRLFVDDTLVYLNKNDKIKDMEDIIGVFCKASTAKFNLEKTEALPIGSKEHQENIIKKRSMGENNQIPDHVNLIKDGDAMRTLGAWVGNGIKLKKSGK